MMLFEKMNAAMRHSAEEGKKRRELDAQKNGGMRAELERGDACAMLISAFLTIVPVEWERASSHLQRRLEIWYARAKKSRL